MSLAQHVTSGEGYDPSLTPQNDYDNDKDPESHSAAKSEWHSISFAIPVPEAEVDPEPHIAAYKVSNRKRILQVTTGVIACWLASGIVFGFAALKPVLIAEGVYSELCTAHDASLLPPSPSSTSSPSSSMLQADTDPVKGVTPCAEQDLHLNLFFTVASITANISSLLVGTILDRYGRRICWLASCVFVAAGSLLMGSSFAFEEFDGYMIANIMLALGGTFLFVPSFQLANAFPKYSGIVVALITGAFDASAAVYLFYRMAYEASGGAFTVQMFFFLYLLVPVLIFAAELGYMPALGYHTFPELEEKIGKVQDPARDMHESDEDLSSDEGLVRVRSIRADKRLAKLDRIESVAGDAEEREERVRVSEERREASGVWGILHGVPAHRQMLSPWYILILLLTVLQMLRMNYFIATIRTQYQFMLGSDAKAEMMNHFFDVALPLGGVLSTPFIGILLNNFTVQANFALLTGFIIAIGVFNCLPYMWAGYATVALFVVFRPLYYSAISDYATKVFGHATFGRIYGTLVCVSGLFNFAQSGIDAMIHGPLGGDPTAINISMGAGGAVIGTALTLFVWTKAKNKTSFEKVEMDEERQLLLSRNAVSYGTRN